MISRRLTAQSQGWMLTLADLLALMLTFFVLLFSMREPEIKRWGGMEESLDQWFNPVAVAPTAPPKGSHAPLNITSVTDDPSLAYWKTILQGKLQQANIKAVTLRLTEEGLVISLPGDVFFAPGSARVQEGKRPILVLLSQALEHIGKPLTLQGHTDPSPIQTADFPSNWELSLARAESIARDLRTLGFTHELQINGYASGRFPQDVVGGAAKRRYTEARRVDILLEAE